MPLSANGKLVLAVLALMIGVLLTASAMKKYLVAIGGAIVMNAFTGR